MNKKHCMLVQILLLGWFFLAMIGVCFADTCLVTRSYADDGIFFIIFLFALLVFVFKENIGKWILTGWLTMWLFTQFLSHEWYTLFGNGLMGSIENKIAYFSDTIHVIEIEGIYIPDAYHIVLHILILLALLSSIIYIKRQSTHKKIDN